MFLNKSKMRLFTATLFILFNIYLIGSAAGSESENSETGFQSEKSEKVRGGAAEKSDDLDDVFYEDEYDDASRENSISGKSEIPKNSTDDGFPNEVFLSLRNITADAATAFRSFTNRNDVVDLQASASDNLNVTSNDTFVDAESAGINLRALRDAGHPPLVIEESLGAVQLPYKHTKIDTADLSDCALQGEWKPMGVAHGHLHVADDHQSHQADVLQSVGSYAVPNKVIPHWQQDLGGGHDLQDGGQGKPSGLYSEGTVGSEYGSSFGYGFAANGGVHSDLSQHHGGGGGGFSGSGLSQFQKIKSGSMLSPPPIPPIIFGKKPGYWKLPKTKHKFFPGKGRRPSGGSYVVGSGSALNHGGGHSGGSLLSGHKNHGGGGYSGSGHGLGGLGGSHAGHAVGGVLISGGTSHGIRGGAGGLPISGSSGHGLSVSGSSSHGYRGGGTSISGGSGHAYGGGAGGASISGGSAHNYGGGAGLSISGGSTHGYGGGAGGASISGGLAHGHGGGAGGLSISGGSAHGYGGGGGGLTISGGSAHGYGGGAGGVTITGGLAHNYGGGDGGSLSGSEVSSGFGHVNHGIAGGATVGHLIAGPDKDLSSGGSFSGSASSGYKGYGGGSGLVGGHLISGFGSEAGDAQVVQSSGINEGHLVSLHHGHAGGGNLLPESLALSGGGNHYSDSTFSSTHITQGGGNSLPDAAFLSSHINQDFAVHAQGVSDDLSSTFTCGKNHDHNTKYHTATFQVADHDHPSSVDVLQYGGDATVLIQSGDASFHDQILPERKHYKASPLSDPEVSSSDNRNELSGQASQLTSNEQDATQTDAEGIKADDGEEPERHSYYHEITKVTKIPATSVGSVEYTFSKYETKPQTFSTESGDVQDEPEGEQPQIIRELEHLSNKFQLDIENPQKLFEDPPSQELAYHYPFQDEEQHKEGGPVEGGKEEAHEGITEFPYQFYNNNANKLPQYPIYKTPPAKQFPRPGKPYFYQKTTVNYLQPKPPVVVLRKQKPKHLVKKKQNYEVQEHGGERHRPIGEIFPPQKFPKQFHNPKPNFAVDRPKNGWRPDAYQEYKYDHSHGKKVKKFKTKSKLVAPILVRRPVSPAPVIRVLEVAG